MACSIQIDSVEPNFDAGATTINGLIVTYTVVECRTLRADVICGPDSLTTSTTFELSADGTFTKTLKIACPCDSRGTVTLTCSDNPDCSDSFTLPIECVDCPDVVVSADFDPTSDEDVSVQDCNFDGSVTVTLNATITPPAGVTTLVSQWDFGDGEFGPLQITLSHTTTHDYETPGTYTAKLIIAGFENCPPETVEIGPLSECPCPSIDLSEPEVSGCAGDGQSASVSFAGTIDPQATDCDFKWNFGDGSPEEPTSMPEAAHSYDSSGEKTGVVTMICGDCTSTTPFTVEIPACEDDGGGGGGVGPGTVVVVDDGGGGEGWACQLARWLAVIAAAIAIVAASLALCIPAAATALGWLAFGSALVALIVALIWGFLCNKPCGWGMLLGWQVALGAGLLLLHFNICCPSMNLIGSGLIASALVLMWLWVKSCSVSLCRLFIELLIILTAVVAPTMAALAFIPVLEVCINPIITAAVAALAAVVTIKIGPCASQA